MPGLAVNERASAVARHDMFGVAFDEIAGITSIPAKGVPA
jgi:hypothetical protein